MTVSDRSSPQLRLTCIVSASRNLGVEKRLARKGYKIHPPSERFVWPPGDEVLKGSDGLRCTIPVASIARSQGRLCSRVGEISDEVLVVRGILREDPAVEPMQRLMWFAGG